MKISKITVDYKSFITLRNTTTKKNEYFRTLSVAIIYFLIKIHFNFSVRSIKYNVLNRTGQNVESKTFIQVTEIVGKYKFYSPVDNNTWILL